MSVFEKNIEALKECYTGKELAEELSKVSLELCEKYIFEEDGILYRKDENGYVRQIESFYKKDGERLFKNIDWNKENLIFVMGIGNRSVLEEIELHIKGESKFVLYEPDLKLLRYIVEYRDITPILIPEKMLISWKKEEEEYAKNIGYNILSMNWYKLAYNIEVIVCPYESAYMVGFKKLFMEAKTKIFQNFMVFGNSLEDVLQGFQQNAKNFMACLETNDLMEIQDKYKGYPAIIVAAGPSLEKNIEELKNAQGKALIISCDASWTACKEHGVKPDMIASIERGIETYQYYFENKEFDDDLVLTAPSLIWDETYKNFKGKTLVVSKNDDGVDGWWSSYFENARFINTGMSCATLAYAIAYVAGCSPIILIGQDLAYTGNKKHSDFTHTEFEGENNAEESDGLMVEDINGELIPTDKYYNLFRFWYEDRIRAEKDKELIDATEGGAKIQGSTIMTLKEAIEKYCTKEKPYTMYGLLSDVHITKEDVEEKRQEILNAADKMIQELYKVKRRSEEHYATLEKLYDRIHDGMPKNQLVNVVKKMQKGDKLINYIIGRRNIITFFQQYIVQTITYVKALGNELTPANVLKNLYAQGNLMGALKRASVMLIDECEKLKDTVNEEADAFLNGGGADE